jgi:hypothetical protein
MKTKVDGKDYVIKYDMGNAVRLPIKKTDKTINALLKSLNDISKIFNELYDEDYELYEFIKPTSLNLTSGRSYDILDAITELEDLKERLKTNDEIAEEELLPTLGNLGFYSVCFDNEFYEKKLVDNDEEEVVEEIHLGKNEEKYRKRTIKWKTEPYGKSSKKITYEDLEMTEEIKQAIRGTRYRNSAENK